MQENEKSFADKMIEAGDKMQNAGSGTQKAGGMLTVLITLPIGLAIFFGIPGLIAGIVMALLFIAGRKK